MIRKKSIGKREKMSSFQESHILDFYEIPLAY